jgi:enamine deaminase RidA (YjgF/YER057c/UK114 family)
LFVSGQVGSRADGSPEPDFEAQVRQAFANLEATLEAGGCTFDDIIDVTSFHTDPERQMGAVIAVKSEKFPQTPYPNWTAVGVNWLEGFDFEIKVTARIPSRVSASVSRRNPPAMWDMASRGWSHISVAEPGRLAFLSGQIAASRGNEHVPDDLAGQAKLATASLAAALKDLEASAQDIVMMRVYVVNATSEAFGQAVTPLRELLGDAMPSITTIGVQALYKPEIKVEIEMVVRLP